MPLHSMVLLIFFTKHGKILEFFWGVNSTNFAKVLEKDSKFSLSHFFNNLKFSIIF